MLLVGLLLGVCIAVAAADANDVLIEWKNITISTKERTILSMGPGSIRKGRLVGVLGPSGCGKSTFLSVLGGMWKNTNNAFTKDVAMFTRLSSDEIAVVPQDYSFFEMLTVKETLLLSARIRDVMDAGMAKDRGVKKDGYILEQVETIMRNLSLLKISNSQVGDPFNTRGISGGERKRLSIACELLGDEKKLIIADEPTSGLDSFQAQLTVNLLRQLAVDKDIAVVCSIHQPRSAIWSMFDDIVLLTPWGKVAYYGKREDIESYFTGLGFTIPLKTNPADFILDLVSIDTTSPARIEECTATIQKLIAAAAQRGSMKQKQTLQDTLPVTKAPATYRRNPLAFLRSIGSQAKRSCTRFLLLLQRAGRQAIRDNSTNLVRILISGCLAWIVGSVNGKQDAELFSDSVSDRINIIAQATINVGMLAMIKTLQLFKRERSVIERERSHQQYSALEYLLAKMCAELPLDALVAAVFGLVLQEKANLRCGRKSIVNVLALLGCASSTLGLAIGSLCPTGDVALAVGPALMVIYVVIGAIGPGSTDKSLPRFLQPLRYASPFRWACEALSVAELQGQAFQVPRAGEKSKATPFKVLKSAVTALVSSVAGRLVKVRPGVKRDGDHALEALGLKNKANNAYAVSGLSNMILIHSLVALVGLWFQT